MLKAVEKKRAYQDVVKQIVNLIQKGKLKKEDQLPSERELTETLKVSRTTVREAMRCLESMRLVDSRQGNGTFVLASGQDVSIQSLSAALLLRRTISRISFTSARSSNPPLPSWRQSLPVRKSSNSWKK